MFPEENTKKIKINLGCGDRPLPGFLNVDSRNIPGIECPNTWAEDLSCFPDNSADYIYACHLLEHIPREKTFVTLCEWNRVLKKGGILRVAVPDWDAMIKVYQQTSDLENRLNYLFGGRDYEGNTHYRVFNFPMLRTLLYEAGFKRITRYNWWETEHADRDDFSKAYIPHQDRNGTLMSLNVECLKHIYVNPRA